MNPSATFAGIYPMQYALFGRDGALDRGAMRRQIEGCLAGGAHGIAVLGLATEVSKLNAEERRNLAAWAIEEVAGRAPVAVTIAGATVEEQVSLARFAQAAGASWLIFQPPPERGRDEDYYAEFFSQVMRSVQIQVAIQNAPDYTGIALSDACLRKLAERHANFTLLKGEGSALQIRRTIESLQDRLAVFNGRGGLELLDNLRAGCAGMIPATDTFDRQVRVLESLRAGDDARAEMIYAEMLPAVVFVMQSLDALICYGKRIAAWRLGFDDVHDRAPSLAPDAFGLACARRYAEALGPLP